MRKSASFLLYIMLFLAISPSLVLAKEISGVLSKGEASQFVPFQGSSFSIIKDIRANVRGGDYDVTIKNNNKVFYHQVNQVDDLYLVFNESVDKGDIIQVQVNSGVFIFKMSHMDTLPKAIVDALKDQVPEQFKQMKQLHNRPKVEPFKEKKLEIIVEETPVFKSETIDSTYNKKPGFFEDIFAKISAIIAEDKAKKEVHLAPIENRAIQKEFPKLTNLNERIAPLNQNRDISQKISSIDNIKKDLAQTDKSAKKEIDSSVTSNKIEKIAQESRVEAPKTLTSQVKDIGEVPVFNISKIKIDENRGVSQKKNEIETFTNVASPITNNQKQRFKTEISLTDNQKPNFTPANNQMQIKKIELAEPIPEFKAKAPIKPTLQVPIVIEKAPEVIVVKKAPSPPVPTKPIIEKNEIRDKIIITKTIAPKEEPRVIRRHIEPEDYRTQNEQVPERMSDRVLGGGYVDKEKATLKVKAYSNQKSVSAWVEVFKAGTNKRVKTFYTGKGRGINDIKLPAGVYVIKATYRTSSSKRKRSLGKVTLKEGGFINKSISFDDGRVVVFVKKNSKPLYAKIEVYKSGSKSLVSYEFSSRQKGRAEFNLAVGEYDIVVKDYNNQQVFDSVFIKSGKSKTINVDF